MSINKFIQFTGVVEHEEKRLSIEPLEIKLVQSVEKYH